MTARNGGIPEKVTRYDPNRLPNHPSSVRLRSVRLAKALLAGQTHAEGGCKVFRARNGAWIMRQGRKTIATWRPQIGEMQLRFVNDGTIIDRLNGISAAWKDEIWFRPAVRPNAMNAYSITYKFRNRHDILDPTVYVVTSIPAR